MHIKQFVLGPFVNNLYLFSDDKSKDSFLIDASFEIEKAISYIKNNNLNLKKVILTHGHIDHICGVRKIKEELNPEVVIHKNDLWLYQNIKTQGEMFGFQTKEPPAPDTILEGNSQFEFCGQNFEIIETPGHTPGSICVKTMMDGKTLLFTGDTLFEGSIGRTDLWGGSFDTIEKSIKKQIYNLDDNTIVHPGHGGNTTVGQEKRSNPFVRSQH